MLQYGLNDYDIIFILSYSIILLRLLILSSPNKGSIIKWFYTLAYLQKSSAVLLFNSPEFRETYLLYCNISERLNLNRDICESEYLALTPLKGKMYYNPLIFNTDKIDLVQFYYNLFFKRHELCECKKYPQGVLYFQSWENCDSTHYYIYFFWKHSNRIDNFWFYL